MTQALQQATVFHHFFRRSRLTPERLSARFPLFSSSLFIFSSPIDSEQNVTVKERLSCHSELEEPRIAKAHSLAAQRTLEIVARNGRNLQELSDRASSVKKKR